MSVEIYPATEDAPASAWLRTEAGNFYTVAHSGGECSLNFSSADNMTNFAANKLTEENVRGLIAILTARLPADPA